MKRALLRRRSLVRALAAIVIAAFSVAYLFPMYLLLSQAFRDSVSSSASPLGLPNFTYWENFIIAWSKGALAPALLRSLVIAIGSVSLVVLLGSTGGYVIARRVGKTASFVLTLFVLGLTLPIQLGLIPLYELATKAGLTGTLLGVVLVEAGTGLPLAVFLYTTFIQALPAEFEEAAALDGAGPFRTYWYVIFPALKSASSAVIILTFIAAWNDFLVPLLFLNGTENATLPVAIFSFVGQYSSDWNIVFAGLLIAFAPVLVLFFVLQRQVIEAFSTGLKG